MDIVGSCSPLEGDVGPRADKLDRARKGPVFSWGLLALYGANDAA
jgi:hypothetical protein